ncbi:hypothetical protein BB381_04845 [Campylobacter pinnipediorum subsp. caledonicus]|uniref:DUF4230 domain-containing protein n=1 Tax=Campylobacter pinnipediorum TaxID=1965231 RepID=UPI0009952AA9|nr:DUF4230 domain-containing protein [Campylobacter pinnipediorum]OPA72711.1 hypothetical protein BB381_04845 [Campylobacter pinnipediorum subsp. caledonicus]
MTDIFSFVLIILLLVCVFIVYKTNLQLQKAKNNESKVEAVLKIEQLKSIGELSVFQVYSKEIVTKTDHAFGNFGKEYLRWLVSEKKLSMIFEFEINFVYDLTSEKMQIQEIANSKFHITMPPCKYKFSIADMKFYDEKNGKFIPFLLPDSLNGFFGSSFREDDKNKLISEAKLEVEKMSLRLIRQLESKIHKSAKDTLEAIAKSFGAISVTFDFNDSESLTDTNLELKNIA